MRGGSATVVDPLRHRIMHDFDDTIDWNEFWRSGDDEDRDGATPSTHHLTDVLPKFVAEKGVPDSFADVGCGPGFVAFDIAERYPETNVVGYDAAEWVLAENRRRAEADGAENLRFETTVLPEFDPGQRFDLVLCYAAFDYVTEPERALETLYAAVAPGGHLVFNYPNRFARTHRRRLLDSPESFLDGDELTNFDAERFEERFRTVLDGDDLLSYRRIHNVLRTWPQSVWSVVEKPDIRWAWRHFPLVYVPR